MWTCDLNRIEPEADDEVGFVAETALGPGFHGSLAQSELAPNLNDNWAEPEDDGLRAGFTTTRWV